MEGYNDELEVGALCHLILISSGPRVVEDHVRAEGCHSYQKSQCPIKTICCLCKSTC